MIKKFAAIVLAVCLLAGICHIEASHKHECFGVVTESSDGIVVADVNMPNGEVHEWAFKGSQYEYRAGDPIVCTIDVSDDIIIDVEHVEDAA